MSNSSAPLLATGLNLKASWWLFSFLCINHVLAFTIVWLLSFPICLSLLLSLVIGSSLYYTLRLHAFKNAAFAISKLYKNSDGSWDLYSKTGNEWRGVLRSNSLHTRYFLILNFKVEQRYFPVSLILCKDALNEADFRSLRLNIL